jgi:hypothetical protein
MELEVQKASLAREILGETDESIIKQLWTLLNSHKSVQKNRRIGIMEGKAFFKEEGNGKITMEEFLGL